MAAIISQNFKAGDVVVLKSGGPEMTITEVRVDYVSVVYFHGHDVREATFFTPTIELSSW